LAPGPSDLETSKNSSESVVWNKNHWKNGTAFFCVGFKWCINQVKFLIWQLKKFQFETWNSTFFCLQWNFPSISLSNEILYCARTYFIFRFKNLRVLLKIPLKTNFQSEIDVPFKIDSLTKVNLTFYSCCIFLSQHQEYYSRVDIAYLFIKHGMLWRSMKFFKLQICLTKRILQELKTCLDLTIPSQPKISSPLSGNSDETSIFLKTTSALEYFCGFEKTPFIMV